MTALSTLFDFDNTYARELEELVVAWQPDEVPRSFDAGWQHRA
jgi:hypothetical protein